MARKKLEESDKKSRTSIYINKLLNNRVDDFLKETGEKKFFYVWLDAPIGYISSTKNYCDSHKQKWEEYWLKGKVQHFIGKDISYFHFLFWPAMLMILGIPVPQITVHGFVTVDGKKMSKSRGTFFTAKDFLKMYSAEALRFYYASHLDRKVIDVDLNFQDFKDFTNKVFMGSLGNFCYRVLTFAENNYGAVKKISVEKKLEKKVEDIKDIDLKKKVKPEEEETKKETLIPMEDYLKASIHLGTRVITPDMRSYVYRRRADGLAVFNTALLDDKIIKGG